LTREVLDELNWRFCSLVGSLFDIKKTRLRGMKRETKEERGSKKRG
jgi:hypothetical protein